MSIVHSDRGEGVAMTPAIPSPSVVLFQKRVMVVLPWQKQVSPITAFCIAQLLDKRRTSSVLNFGDAFVVHSRNSCADVFLQSEYEYMLTIDDDMIVPFGSSKWFNAYTGFNFPEKFAGLNALDRLMSHQKTLIGALYFGRHRNGPPVYNEGAANPHEAEYARKAPYDLIKPTKWVGTGCMLIHRTVFEDIEKRFPRLARGPGKKGGQWFTSTEASLLDSLDRVKDELSGALTGDNAYKALEKLEGALAAARYENGLGCGEDVSFCRRAAAAGHTCYIDMGLVCGHIGHCVYGPYNTFAK